MVHLRSHVGISSEADPEGNPGLVQTCWDTCRHLPGEVCGPKAKVMIEEALEVVLEEVSPLMLLEG